MLFQANPFPTCDCEAQAIILMSVMFASIFVLVFLIVLMWYFHTKYKANQMKFLIVLVIFLFSIVIGVSSLTYFSIPFSPYFQLFFMLIQTIFFILTAIEVFERG